MLLRSQSYYFDAIAHAGVPLGKKMTVETFIEILWTFFEKFGIFIEMSGEKNVTIA